MNIKNKRGDTLMENLVYILLVVVFVSIMYFAIIRAGSQSSFYEQIYAKQIALVLNKAKPGIDIELDTFEMQRIARKNNFDENIITVNNNENKVNVRLIDGKGYDYKFFNNIDVAWNHDKEKRRLFLEVVESSS